MRLAVDVGCGRTRSFTGRLLDLTAKHTHTHTPAPHTQHHVQRHERSGFVRKRWKKSLTVRRQLVPVVRLVPIGRLFVVFASCQVKGGNQDRRQNHVFVPVHQTDTYRPLQPKGLRVSRHRPPDLPPLTSRHQHEERELGTGLMVT